MTFNHQSRLLPREIALLIPRLYQQEKMPDPLVYVRLYGPFSGWEWYLYEFDGEDIGFGLINEFDVELGYISLSELADTDSLAALVLRDTDFTPQPLSQVRRTVALHRQ